MQKRKIYKETERVICPECKGEKKVFTYNEQEHENMDMPCPMCKGEGMLLRIIETTYLQLNHAK